MTFRWTATPSTTSEPPHGKMTPRARSNERFGRSPVRSVQACDSVRFRASPPPRLCIGRSRNSICVISGWKIREMHSIKWPLVKKCWAIDGRQFIDRRQINVLQTGSFPWRVDLRSAALKTPDKSKGGHNVESDSAIISKRHIGPGVRRKGYAVVTIR
jgi:hypothetical protein